MHAVPNRWAGLTAGWLDGFNHFHVLHADRLLRTPGGALAEPGELTLDVRDPAVREHCLRNVATLFEDFALDGLIWDEPHAPALGDATDATAEGVDPYQEAVAGFLDELSAEALRVRPGLDVSLFIQPGQEALIRRLLRAEHIAYVGSDGHVAGPSTACTA